jgi:hypothetical protein
MPQLKRTTFQGVNPAGNLGLVSFFLRDDEGQPSGQWISGQVEVSRPAMKSVALGQLSTLHAARDLIDAEIARITPLYHQAEQVQR